MARVRVCPTAWSTRALRVQVVPVPDGAALANLAEGIQGLVQHMRSEQQMIRDWVEAQAAREKDLKRLLERLSAEHVTEP